MPNIPIMDAIKVDPQFSPEEQIAFQRFHDKCLQVAVEQGVMNLEVWNLTRIAEEVSINVSAYYKEGIFVQALWVIFMSFMMMYYDNSKLKYQSLEEFLRAYEGMFDEVEQEEQIRLMSTANWMIVLFEMIPARKNKGLAIHVIPKIIEGWNVKYVTGSGQTKPTAHRVHIFEKEGDVLPTQRGRAKHKKPVSAAKARKRSNSKQLSESDAPNSSIKRIRPEKPLVIADRILRSKTDRVSYNGSAYTGDSSHYVEESTDADESSSVEMPSIANTKSDEYFASCLQLLRGSSNNNTSNLNPGVFSRQPSEVVKDNYVLQLEDDLMANGFVSIPRGTRMTSWGDEIPETPRNAVAASLTSASSIATVPKNNSINNNTLAPNTALDALMTFN